MWGKMPAFMNNQEKFDKCCDKISTLKAFEKFMTRKLLVKSMHMTDSELLDVIIQFSKSVQEKHSQTIAPIDLQRWVVTFDEMVNRQRQQVGSSRTQQQQQLYQMEEMTHRTKKPPDDSKGEESGESSPSTTSSSSSSSSSEDSDSSGEGEESSSCSSSNSTSSFEDEDEGYWSDSDVS